MLVSPCFSLTSQRFVRAYRMNSSDVDPGIKAETEIVDLTGTSLGREECRRASQWMAKAFAAAPELMVRYSTWKQC